MVSVPGMQRALEPTSTSGTVVVNVLKLVGAAIVTVVAAFAIYLFALLNVYIIAWVVQIIQAIF